MAQFFRILNLSAFSAAAVLAQVAPAILTLGPVDLCESQAVIETHFNPYESTVSKQVSLVEAETGRVIDSRTINLLPGRGESVVYQQGRIVLDADFNEMPDTCRTSRTVIVVQSQDGESGATHPIVRGYDKSHRLARGRQGAGDYVFYGRYFPSSDATQVVSRPFIVETSSEMTVRMMNVGATGGGFTVEILDALGGTVVAAKTVYLDPGSDQRKSAGSAFADFTFSMEPGVYVARIPAHTPEWSQPSIGDPGVTKATPQVAISLQLEDNTSDGGIAVEELHLVHEGLALD